MRTSSLQWGLALVAGITGFTACRMSSDVREDASPSGLSTDSPVRYDADGRLVRPEGYREWIYVGTPLTPDDLNGGMAPFPEFHSVYIDPGSWRHFEATGEFPDGTVLVKELVSVGGKKASSGNGYFMGEFVGLETAVKDSGRFPEEPGSWAYFSFGHEYPLAKAAEAAPSAACNACHAVNAADDFVFTQYYPVLRAAKGEQPMAAVEAGSPGGGSATDMPDAIAGIPTDEDGLFRYLAGGGYQGFAARESGKHPSDGPHTRLKWPVRVFLNATLDASLAAGNAVHPAGSAAVKEMFTEAGELQGWAVMAKSGGGDEGDDWFWYEVTSTTDPADPVARGNGVGLCVGCHSVGQDFVLTGYPLR